MNVIAPAKPTTLLIAAMGGEGGGVLSNWVQNAAETELPDEANAIYECLANGGGMHAGVVFNWNQDSPDGAQAG